MKKGRSVGVLLVIPAVTIALMAHTVRSQSRSTPPSSDTTKSPGKRSPNAPPASTRLSATASQWVEATLRKMMLDEKVGQVLFTTYHGAFTPTDAASYTQMMRDVKQLHVGGFINITQPSPLGIVKSQAYPTAVLANQLQSASKLPLLNCTSASS